MATRSRSPTSGDRTVLDRFIGSDQIPRTVLGLPRFLELVEKALQTAFDSGRYQGRLDVLAPEAAAVVIAGAVWLARRWLR